MADTMTAIKVDAPGPRYRLVMAQIGKPVPGPGEVLIEVTAAGVNRADLAQAMGAYPPPPGAPQTLGLEASGQIVGIGAGVTGHKPGDEVCALLPGGGYAQFCVAPVECVLSVPKGVSLIEAGALPETAMTVWTNLMDAGRLKPGESVLIHGGSSGIGTTAIQLCAALGHTVFTTAGSDEKCAACKELGAAHAINYRKEDFVEAVTKATGGRGVDVILDMVGGGYIERNFQALAIWGRLVNIAFMGGATAEVNFSLMLRKRLSFMATTLRPRSNAEKAQIRDAVMREVWPLVEAGKIRPIVDRVFALAEAQAAHERMAASSHIGKILLAQNPSPGG